jgi:hypothetical protein
MRWQGSGVNSSEVQNMKITTYSGDDYADVSLTDAGQEGLAVECHDEASAIALAAGIAELFRRYAVEPVAVGSVRDDFDFSSCAA